MKLIAAIALSLLVFSCTSTKKEETPEAVNNSAILDSLLVDYYDGQLKLSPMDATYSGDPIYNDYLPNELSDEYAAEKKAFYNDMLARLAKIGDRGLSEQEILSKKVLDWDCNIKLGGMEFPTDLTPIDQKWTQHLTIGTFASGEGAQPFKNTADYKNWIKRLDGYLAWMASCEEKMKAGIETGNVLPKSLITKVIDQLKEQAEASVTDHLFYQPIKNFPDSINEADRAELTALYTALVQDKIIPAYKRLYGFMTDTYLAAGRTTSGIGDTPMGEAFYQHQIKRYTTTNMTAKEIHELGLKEVARISGEMEKIKTGVGYEGDLKSFFDHVRTSEILMPFKERDSVIANFERIHNTMKPQLAQLFDIEVKTGFEVRRTEPFREASAGAEYIPGAMDGSRPGVFYTPIPDPTKYNVLMDEALFLHEAIPGHHYQFSSQQESTTLPSFRKTLWYSAYGEGWALYCESLGKELGLYTDPYQEFGMLSMEMHRAIRLVIDPGMHVMGWTREQAIQYSLDNEAEPEESIINEVERYMAHGGQALSYKIGQLKIRALRTKAEEALGDKFDIRVFHNEVLETGCIPLALLEEKIDRYIAHMSAEK